HERVARLQFQARSRVFSFRNQPDGIIAFAERLLRDAMANQEWRRMPSIDEFEVAVVIQNAKKHGCIAADFRMIAEKAIDVVEDACGVGAQSHGRKRALEHSGEKGGAKTFAGNVGDKERGAIVIERENVEVVASNRKARIIAARDGEMRVV